MANHREHVLTALRGEKTDRIPWLPEINEFFAKRQTAALQLDKPELAPSLRIALEMNAASFLAAPFIKEQLPSDVERQITETDSEILERIITPYGTLQSQQVYNTSASTYYRHEYFIKGPQDYKAFEYYYNSRSFIPDPETFNSVIDPIIDFGTDEGLPTGAYLLADEAKTPLHAFVARDGKTFVVEGPAEAPDKIDTVVVLTTG